MGRPKAWLPFGGELMLPRVVRILGEVVSPIVVVAGPDQDVPVLPAGVEIVRDREHGLGPLNGLAAGLAALNGRVEAAYLSSCDVPFLKPEFVRRVVELLGDRAIAIPNVGGYHHPLAAIYRLETLPYVRELLEAGRMRTVDLLEEVPTRVIEPRDLADVDPAFDSLRNLNSPEEYAEALKETDTQEER